jgi:hypothetical protein
MTKNTLNNVPKSQHGAIALGAKLPSERSFGLLFAVIFLLVAGYAWHSGSDSLRITIYLVLAGAFLLFGLFVPWLLTPLNKLWFQLGLAMGRIVSPIVLGILFFIVITPVAIFMRIIGRDELKLKKQNVSSYWIERTPPGPEPESFKDQF